MKKCFRIGVILVLFLFVYQNCDSAYTENLKKRELASGSTGGSTGGSTSGGTTGGGTSGGISGSGGTTGYPQIFPEAPTSDEEEVAFECGAWVCPPNQDYSCAAEWTDEEWREVFMEFVRDSGGGELASQEALERLEAPFRALGVVFARNSAGILRGRIYLPSFQYCARWERAFDVVQGIGWGDPWGWTPRGNIHW